MTERFHTVVIGAGQAGLSVGYYLKRRGTFPGVGRDARRIVAHLAQSAPPAAAA